MKKIIIMLIAILIALFIISGCTNDKIEMPDKNQKVANFDSCVAAGNPVMESYPAKCSSDGITYTEVLENPNDKPCTKEYMPVCGETKVQCVKAPCPPIKNTYSNRCMAKNEGATILYEGECKENSLDDSHTLCEDNSGIWDSALNECIGIDKLTCESIGGIFNECASACRGNPEAEICTMQCVITCEFQ